MFFIGRNPDPFRNYMEVVPKEEYGFDFVAGPFATKEEAEGVFESIRVNTRYYSVYFDTPAGEGFIEEFDDTSPERYAAFAPANFVWSFPTREGAEACLTRLYEGKSASALEDNKL